MIRRLALAITCSLGVSAAQADDMTLVIERGNDAIEFYFALGADVMVETFGLPQNRLAGPNGTVEFDSLREGTFDMGDELFAGVEAQIGETPALFEAMSLMVHPETDALPLETPLDGMIAIAVCTAPTPATPPGLDELRAYAGYIAYTDTPQAPLSLKVPAIGRDDLTVHIRDHTRGMLTSGQTVSWTDGAVLLAEPGRRPRAYDAIVAFAGVALLVAAGLALALRLGRRKAAAAAA